MKFQIGDAVKPSHYALKSKRDYWQSQGQPQRKSAAEREYRDAAAKRGTVLECDHNSCRVAWSDGTECGCLDYMVEKA